MLGDTHTHTAVQVTGHGHAGLPHCGQGIPPGQNSAGRAFGSHCTRGLGGAGGVGVGGVGGGGGAGGVGVGGGGGGPGGPPQVPPQVGSLNAPVADIWHGLQNASFLIQTFIILNTQFLVFDTQFLDFNAKFVIFTHGFPGWQLYLGVVGGGGGGGGATAPLHRHECALPPHLQQTVAGPPLTPGHISPFVGSQQTSLHCQKESPASAENTVKMRLNKRVAATGKVVGKGGETRNGTGSHRPLGRRARRARGAAAVGRIVVHHEGRRQRRAVAGGAEQRGREGGQRELHRPERALGADETGGDCCPAAVQR